MTVSYFPWRWVISVPPKPDLQRFDRCFSLSQASDVNRKDFSKPSCNTMYFFLQVGWGWWLCALISFSLLQWQPALKILMFILPGPLGCLKRSIPKEFRGKAGMERWLALPEIRCSFYRTCGKIHFLFTEMFLFDPSLPSLEQPQHF